MESVGNFLTAVSKPFNPYIVWEMNPAKCPINSYELYFMTMVITLALYCLISYLTNIGKEKFNLDRMLHRGIYAINGEKKIKTDWSFKGVISKLVSIPQKFSLPAFFCKRKRAHHTLQQSLSAFSLLEGYG